MGAARGLTTPLGELLSDTIEPVAKARDKIWEAQSTEEVLRKISEAKSRLEGDGRVIGCRGPLPVHRPERRPQAGVQ